MRWTKAFEHDSFGARLRTGKERFGNLTVTETFEQNTRPDAQVLRRIGFEDFRLERRQAAGLHERIDPNEIECRNPPRQSAHPAATAAKVVICAQIQLNQRIPQLLVGVRDEHCGGRPFRRPARSDPSGRHFRARLIPNPPSRDKMSPKSEPFSRPAPAAMPRRALTMRRSLDTRSGPAIRFKTVETRNRFLRFPDGNGGGNDTT